MPKVRRNWLKGFVHHLEIVMSLVAIAFVAWWISEQGTPDFPSSARGISLIAAAVGVYALATLLRGWRWNRILNDSQISHKRADAYGLVVVGYMGNNVLPMRGGEILRVVLMGRRTGASKRVILGTVIAERLLDAVSLVLLFSIVALLHVKAAAVDAGWVWLSVGLLTLGAVTVAVYVALRSRGWFESFSAKMKPFTRALRNLLRIDGVLLLACSLIVWVLEGVVFWLVGESVGIEMTVVDGLALNVLASFFALIPAAPGYLGTYDAALAIGLRGLDVTKGPAVAFALLVRFVVYGPITVAGLALMIVRYGGLRQIAPGRLRKQRAEFQEEVAAGEPNQIEIRDTTEKPEETHAATF